MPLKGYFPVTPQLDAGVAPDVFVAETAAAIAAGFDPAMARARSWLQSA